jgi:hypothetical protein
MSSAVCAIVIVPSDVLQKAETLIGTSSTSVSIRKGVELLLECNLAIEGENSIALTGQVLFKTVHYNYRLSHLILLV